MDIVPSPEEPSECSRNRCDHRARSHMCEQPLLAHRGRSMVALEGASPRWCPEAVWEGGRRARGLERPRPAQEWDGGWTWRVGRLCGARTGVGFTGKGMRGVGRLHRGREGGRDKAGERNIQCPLAKGFPLAGAD